MTDVHMIGLFILAALVLLITPGPSVLYIIGRSLEQGRIAGLASVFGSAAGSAVLSVFAAAGLTAVIASSEFIFNIVKYIGVGYLIYLGLSSLLSKTERMAPEISRQTRWRIFTQGFIVALLNPKTALFFLAFVPQFVDVTQGMIWGQTLFFGLLLVVIGIFTDSIYALLAGSIGNWLNKKNILDGKHQYFSAGMYFVLSLIFAFSG